MGCFSLFPCFTSSNHPKRNKSVNPNPSTSSSSADQGSNNNSDTALIKASTEESTNIVSLQTPIRKSRDINEGQVINDIDNKTSATDLDVEIVTVESDEKKENGKLGVVEQIENEKKKEKHNNEWVQVGIEDDHKIEMKPKQSFGVHMEIENEGDGEKEVKLKKEVQSRTISDSSVSSYISYPPMNRYCNLGINEDADQVVIQEDSSESLFSINPRRQSKSSPVEVDDKEVNSPLKISSSPKMIEKSIRSCPNGDGDSLLNPIENLAQWKTLKTIIPSLDLLQEKENLYLEQEDIPIPVSEDPSFKVSDSKEKVKNNTAVTTSLSSWLVDPEKSKSITVSNQEESPYSTGNSYAYSDEATSWKSFEDRPILGAWTIDEVKQVSARSSPRKSPCRNPDETPIIGTVGSYWSHTMQATDSSSACTSPLGRSANSRRNKVNKALSCHSSPTKRRLERAFNKSGV